MVRKCLSDKTCAQNPGGTLGWPNQASADVQPPQETVRASAGTQRMPDQGGEGTGGRSTQAEVGVLAGTRVTWGLRTTAKTVVCVVRDEKPPEALSRGTIYLPYLLALCGHLVEASKVSELPSKEPPPTPHPPHPHFTWPYDLKQQVLRGAPQDPILSALLHT